MDTIFVTIGNSDDKLTQERWHNYTVAVRLTIDGYAREVYGEFYSNPNSRWQNACWSFTIEENANIKLELANKLASVAKQFNQESIAWSKAQSTLIKAALND